MRTENSKEKTIREWYVLYSPMVLRRCRKMLRNEDVARDAMHEVFAKMMNMKELGRIDNAAKYLFRTTSHVCLDLIRARKHRSCEGEEILSRIAIYDDSEKKTLSGLILDRIFRSQKPSTREIAVMVHLDGMTYAETSAALGISVSTIKNRLKELQAFLYHSMEGDES